MGYYDPPEDYHYGPCAVCAGPVDDVCLCPECPVCEAYGDPVCYELHGLVRTKEQILAKEAYDIACAEEIAAEDAAYEEWDKKQADWDRELAEYYRKYGEVEEAE